MRGFTLLETMVTVAISGVLLGLAVPGFQALIQDVRRDGGVSEVVRTLNYARIKAVLSGQHIVVCPSNNGSSCSGNTRWEAGWLAFADPNNNGLIDLGEEILLTRMGGSGNLTIRSGRNMIVYQSMGYSAGYNDTIRVCDARGVASSRSVKVSMQGRVRVVQGAPACP